MPIPSITAVETPRLISTGVAFSLTFVASNSPTSWTLTGTLPTGLSFDTGTGEISGTPSEASGGLEYALSVTATNGDGTSTAVPVRLWVLSRAIGIDSGSMAFPLNMDVISGKLSVPGVTEAAPAEHPPGSDNSAGKSLPAPMFTWSDNDRREIAVGITNGGVLFEPADLANITISLSRADNEGVAIVLNDGEFTPSGSGDQARYLTTINTTNDTLSRLILDEGEDNESGRYLDMRLQIKLEIPQDAREFAPDPDTSAIVSFSQGETKNHTFSIALEETHATADYRITAELLAPTNAALVGSIDLDLVVAYSGGTYSVELADGESLPETQSLLVAGAAWDVTFSIQAVTGGASGIDVDVRAVASAYNRWVINDIDVTQFGGTVNDSGGTFMTVGSTVDVLLRNAAGGTVATLTFDSSENYTNSDIVALIEAALGSSSDMAVSLVDVGDTMSIYLPGSTTVRDLHYAAAPYTEAAVSESHPSSATYTDMSFKLTAIGLPMTDTGIRINSQQPTVRLIKAL